MFLDILEFTIKKINKKKLSRENGFENVVSDLAYLSTKLLLEKSANTKKKKIKMFTIFGGFWGQK